LAPAKSLPYKTNNKVGKYYKKERRGNRTKGDKDAFIDNKILSVKLYASSEY